jgi:CheY-like chemotaxis protein
MLTILVVEDSRRVRGDYRGVTPKDVLMLDAPGRLSAAEQFREHQEDIGLVIMDGDLSGHNTLDTEDLVQYMRSEGYDGIIIAASSNAEFRQQLVAAGCNQEYDKNALVDALPAIIASLRQK